MAEEQEPDAERIASAVREPCSSPEPVVAMQNLCSYILIGSTTTTAPWMKIFSNLIRCWLGWLEPAPERVFCLHRAAAAAIRKEETAAVVEEEGRSAGRPI